MAFNNMFSTGFNSGFGTEFGVGTGGWNNSQNPSQTKTTKQEKFPGLNQQQIANIEKYTANLTGAEKKQEQQKIYQAMIQAIEAENFNDSRTAMENERYRNSLSKTDPRECKFDQSACRQSALVDLVKDARNLKANTDENTVMQMFMQEMDYRGIGMDKLNAYLDSGDESILYETGLKTQRETNQSVQQGGVKSLINPAREGGILPESKSEWLNPIGAAAETVDNAANKFADKFAVTGEGAVNSLKSKIENMSKEEIEAYRKEFRKAVGEKKIGTAYTKGNNLVEKLWNGIKGDFYYPEDDEAFMKWLIDKKVDFGEYMLGADDVLKGEHNPNVIKFFGNIPSSAVKTFTATVRGMTNPYDTMKGLYKLAATEEGHQAILSRYGSWDAFADAMNSDPVGVADDILAVAELGTNIAKGGLKATGKITGNQSLANMANNIPTIGSANDALAQKTVGGIYGGLDKLADMSNNKVVQGANRYVQDVSSISKTIENAKSDFNSIRGKANEWADNIIQNNNRMTKKQQENFKKMSGEDQGKWMNDRNIRTQEDLVDYFIESKNKVDDAMGKIEGQFTSKELTAVLDDSVDFAKKTENKDLGRLQELQTKNANGGLTMQEINEVKRFYEKNNKFNYLKEGTAEKSALATNRDTALRERQQKIATENGLDNLKELNKETQAAKFLADNATNWQSGIKGNNPISLTDWIVFAGDGINSNSLAGLVSKKIFTAPRFQDKLVDVLNYIGGHETKGEINPNYKAIDMKNYEKRILAEELAKVKSEKEFQAWLDKAQEMAGPALPERIDQGGVVAGDRPFITQNGPTADELGIGTRDLGLDKSQASSKTARIPRDEIVMTEKEINSKYAPLESRVAGDDLLNAQDLIEEIKSVGAKVDKDGYVTVYHQTTPENAQKIIESGKMAGKENGIFFSTSENAMQADGRGGTKLEFKIPAEKLELDDIFTDNADLKITSKPGQNIDISEYLVKNNNGNNVPKGYKRLYRGLESEFDPTFDRSRIDNVNGYESWTDNYNLAKQYGDNVYYIDVPENQISKDIFTQDGERNFIYQHDKPVGLNGEKGREYMVYTDHDSYSNTDVVNSKNGTSVKGKQSKKTIENSRGGKITEADNPIVNKKTGETLKEAVKKLKDYGWSDAKITEYKEAILKKINSGNL